MVGYAGDTTIHAVIPRPLPRPQVMKLLNPDLIAIYSCCLKKHTRLNAKNSKSMPVLYLCYGDLSFGGVGL